MPNRGIVNRLSGFDGFPTLSASEMPATRLDRRGKQVLWARGGGACCLAADSNAEFLETAGCGQNVSCTRANVY